MVFGASSLADAMYAPVALRFNHYGDGTLALSKPASAYLDHMREAEQEVAVS